MSMYAPKLFSIQQNAFIKGRNIMDGVLSVHEIMRITLILRNMLGSSLSLISRRLMIRSTGTSSLTAMLNVVLMKNGVVGCPGSFVMAR